MRRALRVVADLALSLGALVGVACLVAALGSVAFGVHPLVFRSGSMAPTIPAGSLAFARDVPAADIRVGDVVSVPWRDSRVTHRVVEVFHRDGSATLKLQGDANDAPDQDLYQVSSAPRVWFSVPVAGRVVAWLSRAPGVFVLAAYAALLLSIVFRRIGGGGGTRRLEPAAAEDDVASSGERGDSATADRTAVRSRLRRRRAVGVGSAVLLLGVVTASPTWAAWTDTGSVTGTSLSTGTVPSTTQMTCTNSDGGLLGYTSMTVTAQAASGYSYFLRLYQADRSTVIGADHTMTTNGSTATYKVTQNDISSLLTLAGTFYMRVFTRLPNTNWVSPTYKEWSFTMTGALSLVTYFSCGSAQN